MTQKELRALIDTYDNAYYNLDDPLITDVEYDVLKKQLKTEEVGVPGKALFNKYTHTTKILSLDKVKISEQEALRAHIERLWPLAIQPKLDGLTLVCYEEANVTRGDSEIGENITANCHTLIGKGNYPHYPVRCEAVIMTQDFKRLQQERLDAGLEPFKNARNAAAGMLRQKNATQVKGVSVIAYEMIGAPLTNDKQLALLADDYNWQTVYSYTPATPQEAFDYINTFDKERFIADYCDIDGLVLKHIGDKHFGATSHHPNNAIAVKMVSEEQWTPLLEIQWSVGRTGKIIPIALFEPIELMGSTVSKATLHNMAYLEAMDLITHLEAKEVLVTKANDIIPAILASRNKQTAATAKSVIIPSHCPACGKPVKRVNDQLFCENPQCKEKIIAQAVHMASRQGLDIVGLSEETIRKMYAYLPEPPAVFYFPLSFTKEHLLQLEGFKEKSAHKLAEAITHAIRAPQLSHFLVACGIPLIGKTASRLIAQTFATLEDFNMDLTHQAPIIRSIEGIGSEMIDSLIENWWRIVVLEEMMQDIRSEKIAMKETTTTPSLTFVITGKLSHPRAYYEALILQKGHTLSTSCSKQTSYLVIDDIHSTSTKAKKARSYQIPLIDEATFLDLLA